MHALLSTSVDCIITSAFSTNCPCQCYVFLISHSLRLNYPSSCIPAPTIEITCTWLGTPFFLHYIYLMFPVFVTRLYWLVSSVFQALSQLSLLSVLSQSSFVCLIIFLVSPSTLSLSVFSSRTWLWTLAWLRLRLQPFDSVLQPCASRNRPTPAQWTRSWISPYTPVCWLSTSGLLYYSIGL